MSKAFSFKNRDYIVENIQTIIFNGVKCNVYEFWEQEENANIFSGQITAKTYKQAVNEFCGMEEND